MARFADLVECSEPCQRVVALERALRSTRAVVSELVGVVKLARHYADVAGEAARRGDTDPTLCRELESQLNRAFLAARRAVGRAV